MGKSEKKYVIISGFNIHDNNRGTAALGYGSISFLKEKDFLRKEQEIINFRSIKNFFKPCNWGRKDEFIEIDGYKWKHITFNVFFLEMILLQRFNILLPFSALWRILRNVGLVAAINGGDGFSDIYNTKTFIGRLGDTEIAIKRNIPFIILPQTLGPFENDENKKIAERILRKAAYIYVRDDKYVSELNRMQLKYEMTKDLSYYMKPQSWNIDIIPNAIGINVSGLAYSNSFRTLSGQFDAYPELIERLIKHFQQKGKTIYLIPHSYNYVVPEYANDDMIACREAYKRLKDKTNVYLIDKNLTSPQVKYVISKMSFFIGTRMHANFAAIYTGVPLFGLAYSYKFEGAFRENGVFANNVTMINNIKVTDISDIVEKVQNCYNK